MKKAIIVTSLSFVNEEWLEEFHKAGVSPKSYSIFFYRSNNEENLLERLRNDRYFMTILDGRLNSFVLANLNTRIGNTLGVYDIAGDIYSIRRETGLPGVVHVKAEEIAEILNC